MYVSVKQHRRVVFALGISLGALSVVSLFIYLDAGVFGQQAASVPQAQFVATTTGDLTAPPSPYLADEEAVVVRTEADGEEEVLPIEKVVFEYVKVTQGCGPHFEGRCLRVRSGPGTDYDIVAELRNEMVLKIGGKVEREGETWYKIVFDEWLRYPERVESDWYVHADYVEVLLDEGERTAWEHGTATTTKKIVVDRGEQNLYAYENGKLFLQTPISTGLALTPTPAGSFSVFKKTPSRYMQGPIPGLPSDQYYDMPGVPWNLYFTHDGAVIHGAYWHTSFGSPYSHGCVNLPPNTAQVLYNWTVLGTEVVVKD